MINGSGTRNGALEVEISTRNGCEYFLTDYDQQAKVTSVDRWGLYKDAKGRKFARSGKESGQLLLHKLLFEIPKGQRLVWKNGNTLDCRRSNLQLVDNEGNVTELEPTDPNSTYQVIKTLAIQGNQKAKEVINNLEPEKPTSKVRGVYFHKAAKKWTASAYWEGKRHSLGYYDDQVEAEKVVTAFREGGPEAVKTLRGTN